MAQRRFAHPAWLAAAAGLALLAIAGGPGCPAAAAAETMASRVEQVTVYPGLAEVLRSTSVAAGARELVLDCLSTAFDLASLRIEADAGIRVGPVSATSHARADAAGCGNGPLDERIRALEDRAAALKAESQGHDLALGYLRALGPAEAALTLRVPAPAPAALPATLAAIQRAGQQALGEQRRLARAIEAVERELQPLRSERDRLGRPEGEVRELRIAITAARAGALRLRYQVNGPTWAPAYRATLDTEGATVAIERLAQVSQHSGEDWTGIALRLSTGSPRSASSGPAPRRWTLTPEPSAPAALPMAAQAFARSAPAPAGAMRKPASEEVLDFEVQVASGEYATEFEVPGAVDIGSGAQRVRLALGNASWPVTVKVQTTPQADASAWLVAEMAPPAGVWPDGPLQLLRGGQVVGESVWRLGTRDRLRLPFGRDEQVRVQVNPASQKNTSAGFIGSRNERHVAHVYEVENRHRGAVLLEVLEASPVSEDERIVVTRQFDPAPQPGDWQDQPGIVAWQQTLAPGQKARYTADYTIASPKDLRVFDRR